MLSMFFFILTCFYISSQAAEHQTYQFLTEIPVLADKSLQFTQNARYIVATHYVIPGRYNPKKHVVVDLMQNKVLDGDTSTLGDIPATETEVVASSDPIAYITDGEKYQHLFSLRGTVQEKTGEVSSLEEMFKDPKLKSAAHSADKSLLALGYVNELREGKVVIYSNNSGAKK